MQLALGAGLMVGVCAPLIGAFLVQRRLSLMGDGIGHVAFAGVAAGSLLDVAPFATALVVAVASAIAIERLRARAKASGDVALALFFYSGIALGVVLRSRDGSLDASVLKYLFGAILTVQPSELWTVAGLGMVIIATVAVTGRALFAVVLDEESARVAGLPVDFLNALIAALTAVTIVAAMRIVGVLLVAALMVLPVASSQVISRSFRATVVRAVAIGVLSVVVGLAAARIWSLAAAATIVLVAAATFGVTSVIGPRVRRTPPGWGSAHPGS